MLSGWYGVGAGLASAVEAAGLDAVRVMRIAWPLFSNLLSDVEMVLAKTDFEIARRHAALAGDSGEAVFPLVVTEYQRTKSLLLDVVEHGALLDGDLALQRNVKLRNPYIDPMSLLQIDLLERWRAGERQDPQLERALFATVRGIARGLQNTG